MSWSVSAWGKAPAVAHKLQSNFESITYLVSEEDRVKKAVATTISELLSTQDPQSYVKVEASGSVSRSGGGTLQHTVSLTCTTLLGYVE